MSRRLVTTLMLTLLCAGLATAADTPRAPLALDNPIDRDGDGKPGEESKIIQRVRYHLQRHGLESDVQTAEVQLERARWSYQRYLETAEQIRMKGIDSEAWVSLGPTNGAGRMTRLAPHPTLDGTLLAGAAGGGVWRTTDGGSSWIPLTEGIPNLSVGAVTYAPSDPDVVYLGSGEGGFAIDFIPGIGLVRSEDGGDTWILPTEIVASQFYRINVDPRDADTLVAATNEGLLRSTTGGATWSNPIPRFISGVQVAVTDVVRSGSDPDRLYAAVWCLQGCPAGYERVMRSEDNGLTWAPAGAGLPAPNASRYSKNRLGLALSPDNDQILYAAGDLPSASDNVSVVYRTTDGGASWSEVTRPSAYLSAQGWYDNTITVKPGDPSVVVAGGVWYIRSSNGGATWSEQNPYSGGANLPHVDAHDLQWQNGTLWVANDGGVWKSPNSGLNWVDCNDGLVTRQYYGLAIDPMNRHRVVAGAQDNGTDRRSDTDDDTWEGILGGDGFECAINPLLPDVVYATIYNTRIYRSYSRGDNLRDVSPGFPPSEETPFITPLTMRPEQPWVLYTGTHRVWETRDAGETWQALPTTVANGGWNPSEIWSVAITPADPDVLMVAKNADVYRSTDGGATWMVMPRGANGLPGRRVVNVELSPYDAATALACIAGTSGNHLYRTTDGGATWHVADDGLPDFTVQVARWDPIDPSTVYAGTDVGVYRSTDNGLSWSRFGIGLPAASVHDLRVLPDGSMMRVATHGRGVWELDIPQVANAAPVVSITSPTGTVRTTVGTPVSATGQVSDPDGDAVSAKWIVTEDWSAEPASGSGSSFSTSTSHTFTAGGSFLIALHAEDDRGGAASTTVAVTVEDTANHCATPRVVPADGPFPYALRLNNTTAYRSNDDPAPSCVAGSGDDRTGTWGSMWFQFTPSESKRYNFSTCGSSVDTVLSAYRGACGTLSPIADGCNDDDENAHCDGARTDSYLELDLEAGQTYRFMVGTYDNGDTGNLTFRVSCDGCEPPPIVNRTWLIPAAAHAPGAGGTAWVTDLNLHNPGNDAVDARLAFLPAGGGPAAEVTVEVAARSAIELVDVVSSVLGTSGSGALRVVADDDLTVSSRTYTTGSTGTFGQFIAAVRSEGGLAPGAAVLLPGLAANTEFRSNIGVANAATGAASAEVDLYAANGTFLATVPMSLAGNAWRQETDIFAKLGLTTVGDAFAVVRNTSSSATLYAYASIVDQRTGDPTYVSGAPVAEVGTPAWIAAAAHADGLNGSIWRTDLVLGNPGDAAGWPAENARVTIQLLPANGVPRSLSFWVPAGTSTRLADVVASAFGSSGPGAMLVTTSQGRVSVTSRTYNQAADGTYGQFIPGADASASAVMEDRPGLLSQLQRTGRFRSNVGFVNTGSTPATVEVEFFTAAGVSLGAHRHTLDALQYYQHTAAVPGDEDLVGGFAEVRMITPGGSVLAYASVVDNGSGDPVFIPAVPLLTD